MSDYLPSQAEGERDDEERPAPGPARGDSERAAEREDVLRDHRPRQTPSQAEGERNDETP